MTGVGENPSHAVTVGQVLGPRGSLGAVRVKTLSDVPHRFDVGQVVQIKAQPYRITDSTPLRTEQVVLQLQGVDTPHAARQLVGEWVTVSEDFAPLLPEGEFFHFQLLGLRVLSQLGEELGHLTEIIQTGSNDVYLVSDGKEEVLIPAVSQVVQQIDLDAGVMVVELIEGLR